MRREALAELDRSELEPAIRDILDQHPDGLKATAIRRELHHHPGFDSDIPMKFMHPWLGALVQDDVIVWENNSKRYRLTEYVESPDTERPE